MLFISNSSATTVHKVDANILKLYDKIALFSKKEEPKPFFQSDNRKMVRHRAKIQSIQPEMQHVNTKSTKTLKNKSVFAQFKKFNYFCRIDRHGHHCPSGQEEQRFYTTD